MPRPASPILDATKAACAAAIAASLFVAGAALAQIDPSKGCWSRTDCVGSDNVVGDCGTERCFSADDPSCPAGFGSCYAKSKPVPLTIAIGNRPYAIDLGDYIALVYNFGVGIAGVVAAVIMMVGGFQYLTAGGDSARVSAAKERITGAIIGLVLALGAYTILNTINPDILLLRLPKIKVAKPAPVLTCDSTQSCYRCGERYYLVKDPKHPGQSPSPTDPNKCNFTTLNSGAVGAVTVPVCIGTGCVKLGCSDEKTATCTGGASLDAVATCPGASPQVYDAPTGAPDNKKDRYICKGYSLSEEAAKAKQQLKNEGIQGVPVGATGAGTKGLGL